jgi:branched-chain amino acid transport system permease protein
LKIQPTQLASRFGRARYRLAVVVFVSAILLTLPILIPITYVLNVFVLLYVYVALACSWELAARRLGLINLGQAAFFGIGSYATAILWLAGYSPIFGAAIGGILAVMFAIVISPTFRLKGMYFALATLGTAEILRVGMLNWYQLSGGAQGLYMPIPTNYTIVPYYYLSFILMASTILGITAYVRSRIGLALMAMREDEDAAKSLGVNAYTYKLLTLMVSAFFVALAGGFYAYYLTYIEPDNVFGVFWSILPVFMVIIGGEGTLGPLLGAAFYVFIGEITANVYPIAEINTVIFAAILILLVLLRPGGLTQLLKDVL